MGAREVYKYYSMQWEPEKFRNNNLYTWEPEKFRNIPLYNGNQRSLEILLCTRELKKFRERKKILVLSLGEQGIIVKGK